MPDEKGRSQLGKKGEDLATSFLKENGYKIRERNFRCKLGEIDIIADQSEYIVFVEVKSRYQSKPAISPFLSMTKAKCSRIRSLGKYYLITNGIKTRQPRFDVIGIVFQTGERYTLEHLKNAF